MEPEHFNTLVENLMEQDLRASTKDNYRRGKAKTPRPDSFIFKPKKKSCGDCGLIVAQRTINYELKYIGDQRVWHKTCESCRKKLDILDKK